MSEIAVSIFVAAVAVLIYRRYRSVFCLPFFWVAYFLFQYLGFLQIRAMYGGISYAYAAAAFGMFYVGLLAADPSSFIRDRSRRKGHGDHHAAPNPQKPASKPDLQPKSTRIKLLFPVLPLNVGLFVSLLGATFVTFVFFGENGIPIFSSFPAMAWVQATSGIVNRTMSVFGPGCYASLGLVAWAVHRESGSRAAKAMMYLGFGLAIISDALLATKAAAILIFIWFNILLFYLNKKREFRKILLPLLIVVVPISFAIVAVRLMSTQGFWQAESLYRTYYDRVTMEQAQPADFIFKYMDRFGPMHGGAMHREVERIEDQLTGRPKTPIPSEFVFDLMTDQSTNTTGLSAALTFYGTGYLEWGLLGMLFYSFLQGLGFGWVHRYLLRQETMNIMMLIFWATILNYLMSVSGSGTVLVSFESVFMNTIPPLVSLLPFCAFFLLPVARKYANPVGRGRGRILRTPKAGSTLCLGKKPSG